MVKAKKRAISQSQSSDALTEAVHEPGEDAVASDEFQAIPIPKRNDAIMKQIELISADITASVKILQTDVQLTYPRYSMVQHSWHSKNGLPSLQITTQNVTESSLIRINRWRRSDFPPIKSLEIDMFNCKTPFNKSHTVAEIAILNDSQLNEARRYAFFGETPQSRVPLIVILENAHALQWHLSKARKILSNDAPNQVPFLAQKMNELNRVFDELHGAGVRFQFYHDLYRIGCSDQHIHQVCEWVSKHTGTSTELRLVGQKVKPGVNCWSALESLENAPQLLFIFQTSSGHIFGFYMNEGFQRQTQPAKQKSFLFTLANPHGIEPSEFLVSPVAAKKLPLQPMYDGSKFIIGQNEVICHPDGKIQFGFNANGSYPDSTGKGNLLFTGTSECLLAECSVFQFKYNLF